jgi:hypothetical protein
MRQRLLYLALGVYFALRLLWLIQLNNGTALQQAYTRLAGKELPRVACYTGDLALFYPTTYAAIPTVVVWPEQACDGALP